MSKTSVLLGLSFAVQRQTSQKENNTQAVEKPTEAASEREGKITDLVESSMNVIVLIFVSGETYPNEFLTREQQRYFPKSFSYVHFAFFQCNYHYGSFILRIEGEALQERRTNELGEPQSQQQGVQMMLLVLCIILLCRGKDETRWVANFRFESTQISELFEF